VVLARVLAQQAPVALGEFSSKRLGEPYFSTQTEPKSK
jgi:hypothetical protein